MEHDDTEFEDWDKAPNIADHTATYELENEALRRDGRLDEALYDRAPWDDLVLLDVGCGTGFWLPGYAARAATVIGVEPDPALLQLAHERLDALALHDHAPAGQIEVRYGSAESLPAADGSVDVVHARFAYFFGVGCEAGLREVQRVLAPNGVFIAVDNSWSGGDFATLLRASTFGNAAIDPEAASTWWQQQGAVRHEVDGGWQATSADELEQILRVEFPGDVVDDFVETHAAPSLTYRFALYQVRNKGD